MSAMKDIPLRNPEQLGAAIRLKRKEKNLTQSELAKLLGAERKWVLHVESGNSKAEIGLVLRAIEVLGLRASLGDTGQPGRGPMSWKRRASIKSSGVCNAAHTNE